MPDIAAILAANKIAAGNGSQIFQAGAVPRDPNGDGKSPTFTNAELDKFIALMGNTPGGLSNQFFAISKSEANPPKALTGADTTHTVVATAAVGAAELAKKTGPGIAAMDTKTQADYTKMLSVKAAADHVTLDKGSYHYVDDNSGETLDAVESDAGGLYKLKDGTTVTEIKDAATGKVNQVESDPPSPKTPTTAVGITARQSSSSSSVA